MAEQIRYCKRCGEKPVERYKERSGYSTRNGRKSKAKYCDDCRREINLERLAEVNDREYNRHSNPDDDYVYLSKYKSEPTYYAISSPGVWA